MTTSPPNRRFQSLDDAETLRVFARRLAEGIYISDAAGNIIDANPHLLQLVGVESVAALAAMSAPALYDDPERRILWLERMERDGVVRDFEWELVRPDGQRRTLLDTAHVVIDPDSQTRLHHGILVDITERKRVENDLREQLIRDPLTGCYNRRFLVDFQLQLAAEHEERWGCIFIDIDHFKLYNDQFGHRNGDIILQKMARFLMREVRSGEPVIRLGGDEFLITLIGDGATGTEEVARRLHSAAARSAPVSFSLGWAIRVDDEPIERTIDRADQELIDVRVVHRSGDQPSVAAELERRKS
jgi:diguanylate cyclase (GGDEF)-like protein/PAS domain S-box-containing protein